MRTMGTAVLLGLLALAPAAWAETPIEQYQRTGAIDPCTVTGGVGDIPNDVEQYAPDFLEAYRAAQRQGCDRDASSRRAEPNETAAGGVPVDSGGNPLPPGSTYVRKPPAPPRARNVERSVRHEPLAVEADTSTPAPILALAAMLALALIGAGVAATWRYFGWGPGPLDPARHAAGEARLRLRAAVRRGA